MKENRYLSKSVLKAIAGALLTGYKPRVFMNSNITFVMFDTWKRESETIIYGKYIYDEFVSELCTCMERVTEDGKKYIKMHEFERHIQEGGELIYLKDEEVKLTHNQVKDVLQRVHKSSENEIHKINSLERYAHSWALKNGWEDDDEGK